MFSSMATRASRSLSGLLKRAIKRIRGSWTKLHRSDIRAPVAHLRDSKVMYGENIVLDGRESLAFSGRSLTEYKWEYKGKGE